MYVYENKSHEVCVVLDGVIPEETPDFVIRLDRDAKQIVVNGTVIESARGDVAEVQEVVDPEVDPVKEPEELDETDDEEV